MTSELHVWDKCSLNTFDIVQMIKPVRTHSGSMSYSYVHVRIKQRTNISYHRKMCSISHPSSITIIEIFTLDSCCWVQRITPSDLLFACVTHESFEWWFNHSSSFGQHWEIITHNKRKVLCYIIRLYWHVFSTNWTLSVIIVHTAKWRRAPILR